MRSFFNILLILLPLATRQWWDIGHMLVATIAEIRMNELHPYASIHFRELTTSINHLVDSKSQTFIESSCWPDDIKAKQYNMAIWNPWHYTDKTYVTDGVFPIINLTEVAVNSIELVKNAIKTLSTNVNKTTAERALFARYLVHVVGDMHQPLHSVALFNESLPSGDLGGNRLKIVTPDGQSQNFHSYWDAGGFLVQNDSWTMPRPLNMDNYTTLKRIAESYLDQYGENLEDEGRQISPVYWATESYKFALNTTYPHMLKSDQATPEYISLTYETSKKRITLAGLRLANLVIDIYEKAGIHSTLAPKMVNSEELMKTDKPQEIWKILKMTGQLLKEE